MLVCGANTTNEFSIPLSSEEDLDDEIQKKKRSYFTTPVFIIAYAHETFVLVCGANTTLAES